MIKDINELIKSKNFPPVLLLFGEEDFLLEESADKILSVLVPDKDSEFDFELLDGDSCSFDDLVSKCSAFPFIAPRRVVYLKNFDKMTDNESSMKNPENHIFIKYLNSPQTTTVLLLTAPVQFKKPAKDTKTKRARDFSSTIVNIIMEKFEYVEFPKVYESDFAAWITRRIKTGGKEIEPEACELLISQTQPSLRALNNEIEKLFIYTEQSKRITSADISKVTGISRVNNVFELQKATGKRNIARSIEILRNILSADRQEILIVTMLSRYFITLWQLIEEAANTTNEFQLAKAIGVNPYFVQEYLNAIRNYSPKEIDRAIKLLTMADEILKSSSVNAEYIIETTLIKIMSR